MIRKPPTRRPSKPVPQSHIPTKKDEYLKSPLQFISEAQNPAILKYTNDKTIIGF